MYGIIYGMSNNYKTLCDAREVSTEMLEKLAELGDESAEEQIEKNRAILSCPPLNCEVGSVEEQLKRQHDEMCDTTKACPDSDMSCKQCFARWSQMPYKEQ